jgi:hypothetical protein
MIVLTPRIRFFALILTAAIVVAVVWRKIATRPTVVGRLADGSKLQLIGFHVGNTFESRKRPSLQERFQAFVHNRPQPEGNHSSTGFGQQSVGWLFLTLHDAKTGEDIIPKMTNVEVFDENSAAHWNARSSDRDMADGIRPCTEVILEVYPRRAVQIRMRCKIDGETLELKIPNWRRVTSPPQWKGQPLPQTRRVGGREYTLKSVRTDPVPAPSDPNLREIVAPFITTCDLEMRDHGMVKNGSGFLNIYEDETGNMSSGLLPASEPVWMLRGKIGPHHRKYDDADVLPVGTVTIPQPGEYRELTLPPGAAERGLVKIALLGAGNYICKDGELTVEVPPPGSWVQEVRGFPDGHYTVHFTPKGLTLVLIRTGEKTKDFPGLAARFKYDDRLVDLKEQGGGRDWDKGNKNGEAVNVRYLALSPGNQSQFSDAVEVQLLNAPDDYVEFAFPAPAPIPIATPVPAPK